MTSPVFRNDPPSQPLLLEKSVHVWCAALDALAPSAGNFAEALSADEHQRAERFCFAQHRARFVVARGVLRLLLSHYTGVEAQRVQFSYGTYGKPFLTDCGEPISFNVSHSHELALFAFTRGRAVGVDLERIRPVLDAPQVAQRTFSKNENSELCALSESERELAFFNCWTRKEAFIKAKGSGLSFPLESFDVSLIPGEPARLLRTRLDAHDTENWSLQALHPAAGYAAALAVEGPFENLDCWYWKGKS
jgi:4'-phosphopantetheinyl transferase